MKVTVEVLEALARTLREEQIRKRIKSLNRDIQRERIEHQTDLYLKRKG